VRREFNIGQQVLLFNSRLKLFPGKLRSKWSGPFMIRSIYPHGVVELAKADETDTFKVKAQRLKPYNIKDKS